MKKASVLLGIVLVAAAYVGGMWPERERRLALQDEVRVLQERLAHADAGNRLCRLLLQLQRLMDEVSQRNYGQAQRLSSDFFDAARAEAATAEPGVRDSLEAALRLRDPVTAALAQADPAALDQLRQAEARLKAALGQAPAAAAAPAPAPAVPPAASPAAAPTATPVPAASPEA